MRNYEVFDFLKAIAEASEPRKTELKALLQSELDKTDTFGLNIRERETLELSDLEPLSEALANNTTITDISVSDIYSGLSHIFSKINENTKIQSLKLNRCDVTKEASQILASMLTNPSQLTTLVIECAPSMSVEALSVLKEKLAYNTSLETLSLYYLKGGDDTASILINIIKNNPNLTSIEIDKIYDITLEGQNALNQALEERLAESQALGITPSMDFTEVDVRLRALLNLMERKPTEARKEILKKALAQCTELEFTANDLPESHLTILFDALKTNNTVKSLDLAHRKLSQKAIESLCDLLSQNEAIDSLKLSHNDIGVQGFENLIRMLENNKNLTSLNLEYTNLNINVDLAQKFINALKNSNLSVLSLHSGSDPADSRNFIDPESTNLLVGFLKENKILIDFQLPKYLLNKEMHDEIEDYLDRNEALRKEEEAKNKKIATHLGEILPQHLPPDIGAVVNDYLGFSHDAFQEGIKTYQNQEVAKKAAQVAEESSKRAQAHLEGAQKAAEQASLASEKIKADIDALQSKEAAKKAIQETEESSNKAQTHLENPPKVPEQTARVSEKIENVPEQLKREEPQKEAEIKITSLEQKAPSKWETFFKKAKEFFSWIKNVFLSWKNSFFTSTAPASEKEPNTHSKAAPEPTVTSNKSSDSNAAKPSESPKGSTTVLEDSKKSKPGLPNK